MFARFERWAFLGPNGKPLSANDRTAASADLTVFAAKRKPARSRLAASILTI